MHRFMIYALAVPLSACALIPKDDIPTQPPTQAASPALTVADLLPPPASIECVNIVQLPTLTEQATPPKKRQPEGTLGAKVMPVKTTSPIELITQAQKEALVEPDKSTYFGKTSEARYTWQPGQIYTVRLAPGQQTIITLPVKEVLLIGLALRDNEFLVVNKKVGKEDTARYVVSITPQAEAKGEYQTALITDTGHQYRLKLIVGTVAMTGLTFEVPMIHEADK